MFNRRIKLNINVIYELFIFKIIIILIKFKFLSKLINRDNYYF